MMIVHEYEILLYFIQIKLNLSYYYYLNWKYTTYIIWVLIFKRLPYIDKESVYNIWKIQLLYNSKDAIFNKFFTKLKNDNSNKI